MVSANVETLSLTALGALPVYTVFKKQKFHLSIAFFPGICRDQALQLPVILSWAIMFLMIT